MVQLNNQSVSWFLPLEDLNPFILRVSFGLLIIFLGFAIGRLLGRLVSKLLSEAELNEFVRKNFAVKVNFESLIGNSLSYIIYLISLFAAFKHMGISKMVLSLLLIFAIILITLSFVLALKDTLPNLIAGFYLFRKEGFREGVEIEVNGIKGVVEKVELLHIKIKTESKEIIYLPNIYVLNSKIRILPQAKK